MTNTIKEMFPDWAFIQPGNWSHYGKILQYASDGQIEIGLYREPFVINDEFVGTYTLQIFDNDDVIFCQTVDDIILNKKGVCNNT